MDDLDAERLAQHLTEHQPAGIAEEIRELVVAGTLVGGMRLPTVRDVAAEIGVSVGTVAAAYGLLREGGIVETRRRGGTRIVDDVARGAEFPGWAGIDLLGCSPDPRLLPEPEEALVRAARHPDVNTWSREHITADLERALASAMTDQPRTFAAVSSGSEGLWLATRAAADEGEILAVEEPAAPGYLAVLESMGLRAIGVPVDDQGPRPEFLRAALDAGARAFVHDPSGAFSDRHLLSAVRALELEKVLLDHPEVLIVEDDALGPVSERTDDHSLDVLLPERTLRVLGFDRAVGIDVRTSVLAGPRGLVERCLRHRSGGISSNSRLLQHALAHMLRDPQVTHRLASARTHYGLRRRTAVEAFAEAGLDARLGPASWALYVEVPDERAAALALSGRGIVVDVGASSFVREQNTGLLRIAVSRLPEDPTLVRDLAAQVRDASGRVRDAATFV